jgi:hypothetical protein
MASLHAPAPACPLHTGALGAAKGIKSLVGRKKEEKARKAWDDLSQLNKQVMKASWGKLHGMDHISTVCGVQC